MNPRSKSLGGFLHLSRDLQSFQSFHTHQQSLQNLPDSQYERPAFRPESTKLELELLRAWIVQRLPFAPRSGVIMNQNAFSAANTTSQTRK